MRCVVEGDEDWIWFWEEVGWKGMDRLLWERELGMTGERTRKER